MSPTPDDPAPPSAGRGVSDDYWDGAAAGRLVLQRCSQCGRIRHYPRPLCPACYSFAVEPVDARGTGAVYSWTVAHHPFDPSVARDIPYVLVTVDLDEGVRVMGRLLGDAPPRIGLAVRTTFVPGPDGAPMLALEADDRSSSPAKAD